ncbi:MAG: radical SAM protein [Kiritimatiellia bacterium]|nr:radical SAM protein [Kiritimatiellia bacterium]
MILQVDEGCPYNRCTFCGMYRDVAYRRLDLERVGALIDRSAQEWRGATRIFLADGDVMRRPFDQLEWILERLNDRFPRLARVGLYANGSSIAAKSERELARLRALKLHTLYLGMESGDEEVLTACRKGETAEQMVEAGVRAQAAGLRMSVMVLLGLGGVERTHAHAVNTAAALNRMQPRLLSALRVTPIPGTELYKAVEAGTFRLLTEHEVIVELREMIAALALEHTVFRANHSSNIVPIEARLPRDRDAVLASLDELLASGRLDQESPGRMSLWL